MSFVYSEVPSLNQKAPMGGYLCASSFPSRPLRIPMRYKNVFTVFILSIDFKFVSINANIHGFSICYRNYSSFSVREILLALP